MSTYLVTGGAGFIGSHLVEALVADGHRVRVLDNFSTGDAANLAAVRSDVEVIRGDLADLDCVRRAVDGVELVFHQVCGSSVQRSVVDPLLAHQAGASGTLHVLLAARDAGVRRVVYGASASAYADIGAWPLREGDPVRPLSPLAVALLTGEHYCSAFGLAYGLETVRLRYFNVFGPRQRSVGPYAHAIPAFIEAMLAGRRPVVYGDGGQSRDFTYVADAVRANLLAAQTPRAAGGVYNVGTGRSTTVLEVLDLLNGVLGTNLRPVYAPARPGEVRHSQADVSEAEADLGYCSCTHLEDDLRRCVEHQAARLQGPHFLRRPAAAGGARPYARIGAEV